MERVTRAMLRQHLMEMFEDLKFGERMHERMYEALDHDDLVGAYNRDSVPQTDAVLVLKTDVIDRIEEMVLFALSDETEGQRKAAEALLAAMDEDENDEWRRRHQ